MSRRAPSGVNDWCENLDRPERTGIRLPESSHEVREQNRGKYRTPSINSIQIVLPPKDDPQTGYKVFYVAKVPDTRPASLIIGDAIDNLQSRRTSSLGNSMLLASTWQGRL